MKKEVKPYNTGDGKKEQVSRMFDRIAPYYDFLNRLLSLRDRHDLAKKGHRPDWTEAEHRHILDVATGTADMALEIIRQHPATERIVGVDISKEMLDIGRKKISKAGLEDRIVLQSWRLGEFTI